MIDIDKLEDAANQSIAERESGSRKRCMRMNYIEHITDERSVVELCQELRKLRAMADAARAIDAIDMADAEDTPL